MPNETLEQLGRGVLNDLRQNYELNRGSIPVSMSSRSLSSRF